MTLTEYIAAGGNRHPAAADWCGDVLAFGSGRNVALWGRRVRESFPPVSVYFRFPLSFAYFMDSGCGVFRGGSLPDAYGL